jgi:small subunit ribosomal protein S7
MLNTAAASIGLLAATAGHRIASRGLRMPLQASNNLIQCQQVRFARKTFKLKNYYGLAPLYTDNMYNQAVEEGRLDDLSYKQIRFNLLWETNSPLQDETLEKYLRYMQRDGRRHLMYELLHKTFYEIKTKQFRKLNKLEAKKAAAAAAGKDSSESITDEETNEETIELNPLKLFHTAVENCKPYVIVTKIKRGGAIYQVPVPVKRGESEWLAMKWLNDLVKERPKRRVRHYHEELAQEIIDAANNQGKVVKKKDDLHKLAQANKAYAHYRWG